MHLHSFRVKNFRRLKDVHVELEQSVSVFVGANNSGKTSAAHVILIFLANSKEKFSIHDFSSECWTDLNALGALKADEEEFTLDSAKFPKISLDLWFDVSAEDLYRVIDLLPSLTWSGTQVGIRIEFGPANLFELLNRYRDAKNRAVENMQQDEKGEYHPWPRTLTDYLTDRLNQEFDLKYYVLDRAAFDENFNETILEYKPQELTADKGKNGAQIIKRILRVDCLDAQRHLSDHSGSRSEDLSRCLSRFYSRNLKKREEDYSIQKALSDAKMELNNHLSKVFEPTLAHLRNLGYPGLNDPKLLIKSALNPATVLSSHDGATVHYALENSPSEHEEYSLPDRYNGLGFKNLIYMVVELLDIHAQWLDTEEDRPPLHLIFIEEPEAHLHTQLQQVFIRKIFEVIHIEGEANNYTSQLVVTTHSPHILYEGGFQPIRYFRRNTIEGVQISQVLNLSAFYNKEDTENRNFLQRYLKLTHCDLFFADAAILVEGNVERLVIPLAISKASEKLKSSCLCILEVGGAFGHRFKSLIEFLGIPTLIITDIDSVLPKPAEIEEIDEEGDEEENAGKACPVNTPGAVTSNQTLVEWLPRKSKISELLQATDKEKTQEPTEKSRAWIKVVYQTSHEVEWRGEKSELAGRTFEEAFALENLAWTQDLNHKSLGLRIPKNDEKNLATLSKLIYKRVKSSDFDKTDFALALLAEQPDEWIVPRYIDNGLQWLSELVLVEGGISSISEMISNTNEQKT